VEPTTSGRGARACTPGARPASPAGEEGPLSLSSRVYIISDLHIGGAPGADGDRGFRILTRTEALVAFIQALARPNDGVPNELVINGDFVDFLAEKREGEEGWVPLREDPRDALRTFLEILARPADAAIFQALRELTAAGQRLTILLGNHDLELSYPLVREALLDAVGGARFLYDNEALVRGDAVIEHGNRYDRYNQVDHDALRRARSLQSRGMFAEGARQLSAPAGSRLVARVMNPLKRRYAFVDLLKPETGSVIPTLLALDPDCRDELLGVARALAPAVRHGLGDDAQPSFSGDISHRAHRLAHEGMEALERPSEALDEGADALEQTLRQHLGADAAARFQQEIRQDTSFSGDISLRETVDWYGGLARLLSPLGPREQADRLRPLLRALRSLWSDQSFSRQVETDPAYVEGASALVKAGASLVVFGHTHLAKDLGLPGGGRYLNTGTWAERIRLPAALHDPDEGRATQVLSTFLADLAAGRLSTYLDFEPTFARLELSEEGGQARVADASLRVWGVDAA